MIKVASIPFSSNNRHKYRLNEYGLYCVEHPSLGKGGKTFFFATNPDVMRLWASDEEAELFLKTNNLTPLVSA
jgi:hypothetical protein